jgi:hypothetical protein
MAGNSICKLCGKHKKLIKAHIIPRGFYIDYKKQKYRSVDLYTGNWIQKQCGAYDSNILCSDCDNGIFKIFDDEGYKILLGPLENFLDTQNNEFKLYHLIDFNYNLLRKFFISILWRASVSEIDDFKNVDLGPYEDVALKILLNEFENKDLFNVIIFKCPNNKEFDKIVTIQKGRLYKTGIYEIFMASYRILILMKLVGFPYNMKRLYSQLFMTESNLYILESEQMYKINLQYFFKFIKNWQK